MNPPREERIFEPTLFKSYLRSKLISLLDSIAGRKLLLLERIVSLHLNMLIEPKMLTEHGVPEEGGIVSFEAYQIDKNHDQIMLIISPTLENLRLLKELITVNLERGNKKYFPCFWPKRSFVCKEYFEQENLMQYIEIKDFSFDLLPLDVDLYSLELNFVKELYINNNHSVYTTVAESIHRLQCVFGRIHNIYGKGRAARSVYDILKLKEKEIKNDDGFGDIESVIIVDRAIDFVTPLLRQTTYEGLIDEFFGISDSIVRVPTNLFEEPVPASLQTRKEKEPPKTEKLLLMNSEKDYIFEQIRILNPLAARSILVSRQNEISRYKEEFKGLKDITEKGAAVKKISLESELLSKHLQMNSIIMEQMKSIAFHKELILQQRFLLGDESEILEYFENMIPFEIPLPKVLRSMCLQAIVERGISKKIHARVCEDICFTYGLQHVVSLTNLANLGLFYEQGYIKEPYNFNDIKKELKLLPDAPQNSGENPSDPSFAYGGYTPIVTKLVEAAIRNGWKSIPKALRLLPGDTIMPDNPRECTTHSRPAVVVYFIGGVTYGEVATMRYLSKVLRREIIVATTDMINGESFIKKLIE